MIYCLVLFIEPTVPRAQLLQEPANLPISKTQLRRTILTSDLVAHALITAYEPPTYHDHVATLEKTTIKLQAIYAGTLMPESSLTYSCFCHYEQTPKAADMIGHEILIFLKQDRGSKSWFPATSEAQFYYNDILRDKVLRALKEVR